MRTLILPLLLVLALPAAAEFPVPVPICPPPPQQYLCGRAKAAPVIDGKLDDDAWQSVAWSSDFVDIEGDLRPAPTWQTAFKMLWDERNLYVAANLQDPNVWGRLEERDSVIYHDNDFEVFIDPDGDHHLYYELEINALGTEWDLLLARPYRDGGPAINAWDIQGLRTAVQVRGTLNDPVDIDQGWTVEMALPMEVLSQCAGRSVPPGEGDIWRLNFSRVQWHTETRDQRTEKVLDPHTGQSLPEENWVWSPQGLIAMHYPERWGEVMFVAEAGRNGAARFDASAEHRLILAGNDLMSFYYLQREYREQHGRYAPDLASLRGRSGGCQLPEGAHLELHAGDDRFLLRLATEDGEVTVNEEGRLLRRLLRRPLDGNR